MGTSKMNKFKPTSITADRNERVLKITWSDGHESAYPFAGLRAECPCAECRGGHENMGQPPNQLVIRDTPNEGINIEHIEAVGTYDNTNGAMDIGPAFTPGNFYARHVRVRFVCRRASDRASARGCFSRNVMEASHCGFNFR
jgi:DUF971 family protein